MAFGNLLKNIGKGLGNLQKQNKANPNEQTAHGSIFDKIKGALDNMKENAASTNPEYQNKNTGNNTPAPERDTMAPLDMLKKKIEEVKIENAADPNVPTAEESVFERMKKLVEEEAAAEAANTASPVESGGGTWSAPETTSAPPVTPAAPAGGKYAVGNFAMTNSMGGSLSIRLKPDFGAPTNSIRIPESSKVKLLEYSEHTVNIDGFDSRWARVDFDGTEGWILETYLNFG